MNLKNLPKIERPREKLILKGAQNLKENLRTKTMPNQFYKEKENL